ncbi:hypothetical protein H6F45_00610 [Sphaerospermopsis sp. FACHB-1194]|nr:hypothetical protein [Sphaerospermopsis sp. FACHB-1194]
MLPARFANARTGVRSQESGVRSQESGVRSQKSEVVLLDFGCKDFELY